MAGAPKGNKNAVKENRIFGDELRKVVAQNRAKLRAACEKMLESASAGDLMATKELRDTLDGKPTQAVEQKVDGSLTIQIVRFGDSSTSG